MKAELQKQLTGWGVWLETVEITEVKISSNQLFQDRQAKFRNSVHLTAEEARQNTTSELTKQKNLNSIATQQKRMDSETDKMKFTKEQELNRENANKEYNEKVNNIEKEKIDLEKILEMRRIEKDNTIQNL